VPQLVPALFALLLAAAPAAQADSWSGPVTREVFSRSGDYFVRVVPGESLGDTYGFASAKKGRYAQAEFYRRGADRSYRLVAEAALLNPMAPYEFFVADDGRLATLDNWHNLGYGKVVSVYDARGKLVRAYELRELFPQAEIGSFPMSISSIYWRKGPAYVVPGQQTLLVTVKEGAEFVFSLESGTYKYCESLDGAYRCR
jgi:hypothetical protein